MSLYAIGDLHLSFGSDKPMDIFTGWQDYVSKIKKNWENIVKETDTVVIPGDVSWAMDFDSLRPDFDFIDRLPGSKLIIKGNHDYWWST
ncbi:MAG TPA: metallophosphoesterase, partial [Clostridia bacterium]|nr:metallophosphoesterase [Clostridia bacterium]